MEAPKCAGEADRIKTLREYQILDSEPEPVFDDITKLAAMICQAPIAAITFIDENRQWFKSEVGFGFPEIPLNASICAYAILEKDLLVVPDTTKDPRFIHNPLVQGNPHLRFYAGAVIKAANNQPLGTLCVLDSQVRELNEQQQFALKTLARQVMAQMELRRSLSNRAELLASSLEAQARFSLFHQVGQILNYAKNLATAGPGVIEAVCNHYDWELGCLWLAKDSKLEAVSFWKRAHLAVPEFESFSRGYRFEPGEGLPGRVWQTAKPLWVEGVSNVTTFPRQAVAVQEGLRSAVGFPIISENQVLGVLEFFSAEMRKTEQAQQDVFSGIGRQVGQFMARKQAEAALARSHALSQGILNSALDCFVAIDEEGRIVEFNPAAERIFGYAREEALGQIMGDLIVPPAYREQHKRGLSRYLSTREAVILGRRLEVTAQRKNGDLFPCELAITRIGDLEPILFAGHLRDITERKRAQEALALARAELEHHAAQLEQTVQSRTSELTETIGELEGFSYSIAHDMRAPLRAMQAYSSILKEELAGKIDKESERLLQRIASAAGRMDRLILDILDYSKVVRGQLSLTPVDLHELTLGIIESYSELAPGRADIRIAGRLPTVLANEAAMTQVLSNLLGNAVKFVAPDVRPSVVVTAEPSTLGSQRAVKLTIQDNGIGISHDTDKERLFQIFARVHPSGVYEGTGIGLAIVKKAVERMGGTVGLESEPGQGSRFWVELRVPDAEPPEIGSDAERL